jgi:DNA polymerase-3 subunit delta
MSLQSEIQKINQKKIAPVYVVHGTEDYLMELFKNALSKNLLEDEDEMNKMTFDMEETPLSAGMEEAETIPFFGDNRLVFVEKPYFLTAEKKTGGPDHDVDELIHYLEDPVETTVLVFLVKGNLDGKRKVVKALKKSAVMVDVNPMKEGEVRQYVGNYLKGEKVEITPEAFDLLLDLTNFELGRAMNEVQKLLLFVGTDGKITVQVVRDLVPKSLEHNLFDMTNYVLSGNAEAAIELLQDLLLQGEEIIKINAILISQVRLLIQTRILMNLSYQQANIAETLKIHPYRVKLAMQQARKFSGEVLSLIFDSLVENDYKMKTGQMDKELLFQLFILQTTEKIR